MEMVKDCKACRKQPERKIEFNGKTGNMDVWFACKCGRKGAVVAAKDLNGSQVIQAMTKWNEAQR